ncbi:hypothetical protein U1Q18_007708 [Sarracenia purpurea var. burkii]
MEVIVSSEGGEHEFVPVDKIVFSKVDYLHLEVLPSFTALCKDMIAIEMPELKTLRLYEIPKLQYLCPPESNHNSMIQSLFHNKGPTQLLCLRNLTSVWVEDCGKLKSVFSISMARHLIQLQRIYIERCDEMEVIVSNEGEHEIVPANNIVFPKVHQLRLEELPSFTALCKDMIAIEMPELKSLKLQRSEAPTYRSPSDGMSLRPARALPFSAQAGREAHLDGRHQYSASVSQPRRHARKISSEMHYNQTTILFGQELKMEKKPDS